MNILNYKLDTTNELLTSRIGLITPAHTIQVLDLSKTIDQPLYQLGFVRFFGFYFWIGGLSLSTNLQDCSKILLCRS
jgi:hypothetical protein